MRLWAGEIYDASQKVLKSIVYDDCVQPMLQMMLENHFIH